MAHKYIPSFDDGQPRSIDVDASPPCWNRVSCLRALHQAEASYFPCGPWKCIVHAAGQSRPLEHLKPPGTPTNKAHSRRVGPRATDIDSLISVWNGGPQQQNTTPNAFDACATEQSNAIVNAAMWVAGCPPSCRLEHSDRHCTASHRILSILHGILTSHWSCSRVSTAPFC